MRVRTRICRFPPKMYAMVFRFPKLLVVALAASSALLSGAVDRIELSERSDVLDGKSFGTAGPYERMIGKVFFSVDPKNTANRNIADIDFAPVNEKGLV